MAFDLTVWNELQGLASCWLSLLDGLCIQHSKQCRWYNCFGWTWSSSKLTCHTEMLYNFNESQQVYVALLSVAYKQRRLNSIMAVKQCWEVKRGVELGVKVNLTMIKELLASLFSFESTGPGQVFTVLLWKLDRFNKQINCSQSKLIIWGWRRSRMGGSCYPRKCRKLSDSHLEFN